MSDYKSTVHLPQTEFPMKANLPEREPLQLQRWEAMGLYQKIREQRAGAPRFVLHDGPPYANGRAHLGHAVNRILKDMIIKSKTLSGFDAPFVPGWDCHGLPIELNVEKKIGKASTHPKETFREACRAYAQEQIHLQREAFKRMGTLGDWLHPYRTLDQRYEAGVVRALAPMLRQGYLKSGYKPVHWCLDCGSSLAEAELEYADKRSPAIDVRFTVSDRESLNQRLKVTLPAELSASIPIWTTTPWTLPANQAVALNPELDYVVVETEVTGQRQILIVATALWDALALRYGAQSSHVYTTVPGQVLEGLRLQHPFAGREVPVVLGEHVTLDMGTGAVHTAPAHGVDDHQVGMQYGLPLEHTVQSNGVFAAETPLVGGLHVWKANAVIIDHLKSQGLLLDVTEIEHSYPHCWRHKTPIIFRATPQWFINLSQTDLRQRAMDEIQKVQWLPEWGQERIESMIQNRPDWCISRQRVWGIPLALLLHRVTGAVHPRMADILETIADGIEQHGLRYWDDTPIETWLDESEASQYEKNKDILDVWVDSGLSHVCVLEERPELYSPADVYLEGSDQHRGWFQSSLLTAVAARGHAPYRTVLTHGFTLDAEGNKMSKSLGNVVDPEKIMNSLGADVLRWWVASSDYRTELTVSEDILKRASEAYRRLRNTARYLLSNLHDFDPEQHAVPVADCLALDQALLARLVHIQSHVVKAYEAYQFHAVTQWLHHFCVVDLGAFYLDVIKDRQYTCQKGSLARRSAQTAMHYALQALVRWMAPILSFTAEELWHYLPHHSADSSVFFSSWSEGIKGLPESTDSEQWSEWLALRALVNKAMEEARAQDQFKSSLEAEVTLYVSEASSLTPLLKEWASELNFLLLCAEVRCVPVSDETHSPVPLEAHLKIGAAVVRTAHEKCERCRNHVATVGQNTQHATLCTRCVSNIEGEGEHRAYC